MGEFCQKIKKELIPIFLKFFQKIGEGTLPNLFYEANMILTPQLGKETSRKETTGNYP